MRIRKIEITAWRHFKNISLTLTAETGLVCIVGANGTGKSHLLELIAACAYRLGLSPGAETARGDPFADEHDFLLSFFLATGVNKAVDDLLAQPGFSGWDRTLTIGSQKDALGRTRTSITAGGISDPAGSANVAASVIDKLRSSSSVYFLSLDADRAYPKKNIQIHEIAQAYEIDWIGSEYTKGRSFRSTTTLYDEWIKYFLARENQAGTSLIKRIRQAREKEEAEPAFEDHFLGYKKALQQVLPHLVFAGIESKQRRIVFNTTGLELSFDQLSGGEREIAFLVGQIDRFGLRHGLFLLDEPELHLNSDLIRAWVGYLTSTVETGQIWLATHSLEAVEAAGQDATFVLERNEHTRKVDSLARLDQKPVLSALSRAVGTPAFSISKLAFVFIEGEEAVGERERYRKLSGLPQHVRFMECGSCQEVVRRVGAIRALASESDVGIRVAGVVDRDFRSDSEASGLTQNSGVFVLSVHEVENFFLDPKTLNLLAMQNGRTGLDELEVVREAADSRAGSWVFQYAMASRVAKHLPEVASSSKDIAKGLNWQQLSEQRDELLDRIVDASSLGDMDKSKLRECLRVGVEAYSRKRMEDTLWKTCEGKQVLNRVARALGFADAPALSQAAFAIWSREGARVPRELVELRSYLENLQPLS